MPVVLSLWPPTASISITWELVINAGSQPLSRTSVSNHRAEQPEFNNPSGACTLTFTLYFHSLPKTTQPCPWKSAHLWLIDHFPAGSINYPCTQGSSWISTKSWLLSLLKPNLLPFVLEYGETIQDGGSLALCTSSAWPVPASLTCLSGPLNYKS